MLTIIVNGDDEIIGAKNDRDVTPDDIYRCAGLWLVNSKGEVLLAQRKFSKQNDPGKWGPAVSGTVEEGETYESNIYKEAEEEIGLRDYRFDIGPKVFNNFGEYKFWVQWFTCSLDWPIEKFQVQEAEVERVEWIGKDILKKDLGENPRSYIAGARQVWSNFL